MEEHLWKASVLSKIGISAGGDQEGMGFKKQNSLN